MEKEIIGSWVASLPETHFGSMHEDDEMWEEQDGGAWFKVTRHVQGSGMSMMAMSITGPTEERRRVIGEFSEVFGQPARKDISELPNHLDFIIWSLEGQTEPEQ